MIHQIKSCRQLIPYLKEIIEDEGIEVGISEQLDWDHVAIIKVDEYYHGLHLANIPKAIDHLVVVDCECNSYVMYLLELKNVKGPQYLNIRDEYYGAAEPPVRCGESHLSGLTEPPVDSYSA